MGGDQREIDQHDEESSRKKRHWAELGLLLFQNGTRDFKKGTFGWEGWVEFIDERRKKALASCCGVNLAGGRRGVGFEVVCLQSKLLFADASAAERGVKLAGDTGGWL